MTNVQAITPNPNVPCTPGDCLIYVQDAGGITQAYLKSIGKLQPSAIAAWNTSNYQHRDRNFPAGLWVPLWFTLTDNKNGHVVWRQPDGSVWSSSSPTSNRAVHHASIEALISYYGKDAQGRTRLSYLGWTEDIESVQVIRNQGGDIPMDQVTKIYELIDGVNKRLDTLSKVYDDLNASNQDRDKLWTALNETNKVVDALTKEASNDDKLISSAYIALDGTNKRVDILEGKK